jgi:hypothetical protein
MERRRSTTTFVLLVCLLLGGVAGAKNEPLPTGIEWPVASGWKQETIPFPLDFAPAIAHRGVEELRFAPGFFDDKATGWWSYVFAWLLEDDVPADPAALSAELERYFAGLSQSVASERKLKLDAQRIKAHLEADPARRIVRGTIALFDVFGDGRPVMLNVEARRFPCSKAKRHVLQVTTSPRARPDPIWTRLDEQGSALRCR